MSDKQKLTLIIGGVVVTGLASLMCVGGGIGIAAYNFGARQEAAKPRNPLGATDAEIKAAKENIAELTVALKRKRDAQEKAYRDEGIDPYNFEVSKFKPLSAKGLKRIEDAEAEFQDWKRKRDERLKK